MGNTKSVASVICEYNPFHFGHKFQLNKLKDNFESIVCIISGDIVQRGSVAIADKYLRAQAALASGANLVLELPLPWCCASAADFARAGVFIAGAINSNVLAFGAEDDMALINDINALLQSSDTQAALQALITQSKNLSYPAALSQIAENALGKKAKSAIAKPNNVLALEYLKSIQNFNRLNQSSLAPYAIKRDQSLLSSSQIRALGSAQAMLDALPDESRAVFGQALENGEICRFPRDAARLDAFFIGTLRKIGFENTALSGLYGVTDDLFAKIIAAASRFSRVEEVVLDCSNKIYTEARVRRAINSIVFGIKADAVLKNPPYTTVLAADKTGCELLKQIKKEQKQNKTINIITKPVHALSLGQDTKSAYLFSKSVEDIVLLSSPKPAPASRGVTPTILKK